MELESNPTAPALSDPAPASMSMPRIRSVLADSVPANKTRMAMHSGRLLPITPPAAAFSSGSSSAVPRKKNILGKLDDARAVDWLDAMKASSPPRKKQNKDAPAEFSSDDTDASYRAWQRRYPSALGSFEHITSHAAGKRIALFLDYDGTLSPIVDDPDRAFMSDEMRAAVKSVAKCFPTAIVSGRSRDKVYEFVGLRELHYAGSHGMDIMVPGGVSDSGQDPNNAFTDWQGKQVQLFQPASEFISMMDEVFKSLVENTEKIEGAKVETNKFCVSVHYRNVDERSWSRVAQLVHDVLNGYPRLRLNHGRKVLEIRPEIDWDKGKAVEFLLESLGLGDCKDVLPIYIGDDRTDEDAFKVLRERKQGCGILVSSFPRESRAFYSLTEPFEVMEFLKSLVRWNRSAGSQGRATAARV